MPSEQAADPRKQGRTRWRGHVTARLARQRREELADDHPRGPVEQATTDARHLATDRGLVDVADRRAAILGRNEGDASLAAAETERALGGAAKRDGLRRIELGQFHIGAIASFHRADADRDVSAKMRVRDFLDIIA